MGIWLIAIGLLLTGIDTRFGSHWFYPEFHTDGSVGQFDLSPSIQTYTIDHILGKFVRIDVLPDALGGILILIGILLLLRYNRQYWYGFVLAVIMIVFSVLLRTCGFIEQGPKLVIWVLVCYGGQFLTEIFMEYFTIYATAGITDVMVNQAFNTRMLFAWWISAICRGFMTGLDFVGHLQVSHVYYVVNVLAILFYVFYLIRSREFVGQCEPTKISVRRKRDKRHASDDDRKMSF